jgi:hypothetical protein
LVEKLENSGSLPSGTLEDIKDKFNQALNERLTLGGVLQSLVFALVLYPIFSMLGALMGYGLFGKKKQKTSDPSSPPM